MTSDSQLLSENKLALLLHPLDLAQSSVKHKGGIGKIAGNARKELEKKTGRKVVSSENFLGITGKKEN